MLYPVRIIALTGKKGCGKSIASEHINKLYNSHKLSFSTPLKKAISEIFDFRNNECYDVNKNSSFQGDICVLLFYFHKNINLLSLHF